ncbi:hypothetical protein ACJX0J_017498 [Zea mays]
MTGPQLEKCFQGGQDARDLIIILTELLNQRIKNIKRIFQNIFIASILFLFLELLISLYKSMFIAIIIPSKNNSFSIFQLAAAGRIREKDDMMLDFLIVRRYAYKYTKKKIQGSGKSNW